jgi:predicted AlkP superfamily phosphohydrolase/phosphomutase
LPFISSLCESGVYGTMQSCLPPITVPAWACMTSGMDPGSLGLYGFRNRASYEYQDLALANSRSVGWPRLWEMAGQSGLRSVVLGVPPSYPAQPIKGLMVGCFLTPEKAAPYTWPPELAANLDEWAGGEYHLDVKDFRTADKERLLRDIREMTRARFQLAGRLLSEPWDLFMMVEMGTDRIHHGFWRHHDPTHRLHDPDSPYVSAIRDYYQELDGRLAGLVERLPAGTLLLIVSDHGVRAMRGGVAINQWLRDQGLLRLKNPEHTGPVRAEDIDWAGTKVWGEGGYYARLCFNVAGREPQGQVPAEKYQAFRAEIKQRLEAMQGPDGRPLGNRVIAPQEVYPETKGIPPDLMVFFGDLAWRSLGSLGHDSIFTFEDDRGPDDANHAPEGVIMAAITGRSLPEPIGGRMLQTAASIFDVTPTVLRALGLGLPGYLRGSTLDPWSVSA